MAELIVQLELGLNKGQARFTEAARKRSEEFSKESLEFEKTTIKIQDLLQWTGTSLIELLIKSLSAWEKIKVSSFLS